MKKYDSYKPSGIEWLGDIPSHWESEKVKYIFEETSIKNFGKETMLAATQNKGVIPKDELENKSVEAIVTDLNSFKLVQKGNFVISLRSFEGGIEYSNTRGIISPAYTILQSKTNIENRFFRLLFKSYKFIEALNIHKTGIREGQNISFKKFKDDYLILPPKDEQEAIANFLDKKCEAIDNYILKQQEIIKFLKEKKSSLINQAVTKGLDPKVEYKDSEIEWLGKIPKHWEVKKLKFLAKIKNGQDQKNVMVENGIYPIMGSGGEFGKTNSFLYDKESVLLGRKGTVDKPLFIDTPFWTVDTMYYTEIKKSVLPKFFYYLCLLIPFNMYQYGSAIPSMSQSDLNKVFLTLPPKQEQKQIVGYIEKESSKIDKTISHIEDEIKLLNEYKQSLISSAVTGKIKVI